MRVFKYTKLIICALMLAIPVLLFPGCAVSAISSKAPSDHSAASPSEKNENPETSRTLPLDSVKSEDGPREHGHLRVEQGSLTDENGSTFQLRGMSTHGIGWYPDYINAGAMDFIRSKGGNVMRIAMYTQADSGYLSDPERSISLVRQAIENARAMNIYVIIDWHILDDGDPNSHLDSAITFFDAIASSYPDDPAILYELCNEPNGVGWEAIERYVYAVCPVIRQYSPNAVLIVGTPLYSTEPAAAMNEPLPMENLLYSFHYYAGAHSNYSGLQRALEEHFPVMVSEWGVDRNSSGLPALDEGREFLRYLNDNGVSWCAWSLCNKDEVYSVLRPDCGKLSGWQDNDLTAVGSLIFSAMGGKSNEN